MEPQKWPPVRDHRWVTLSSGTALVEGRAGLPDFANEDTGCLVKSEFQINDRVCSTWDTHRVIAGFCLNSNLTGRPVFEFAKRCPAS